MLTERDLLIDIIQNSPNNSVWNVSSDSWGKIPELFSPYISMNNIYGWDIIINQHNREHLIKMISEEEICEKIVHQDIKFNDELVFKSYDHMAISYLKNTFPHFDDIMKSYQNQEIELLKLNL